MNNIPRIVYGNDLNLKIYVTELIDGEPVPYDLSECTDVQVQMFCSKHKTMFELPFTIDEQDSSVIDAQIDYRLTHPNTMYGFVVNGYDKDEQHFQWVQKPNEGIMYVEGSSGAYIDTSMDNTVDIAARIGFNLGMSNVYSKDEVDDLLDEKQDTLVSGVNIKTINHQSIVGSGNINIQGGGGGGGDQVQADWNQTDDTQPDYIWNKPTIPTKTSDLVNDSDFIDGTELATDLATKQDTLVSGTNIKTINNESILGSGNIEIQGGGGEQEQADWNQTDTSAVDYIKNKPDLSIYAESSDLATVATTGDYNDLSNTPDLSIYAETSDLATVATTGDYNDLSNTPDLSIYAESSDLATVATSGSYNDLSNKPDLSIYAESSDLATVATSGSYNDLSNKPDLSIYVESSDLATVATSGSYTDLSNKPTIPSKTSDLVNDSDFIDGTELATDLATKQDTLVSGTNVKTINDQSILGSGNLTIESNVQPDYEQTDDTQPDYIKNKPTFDEPKIVFTEETPSVQEEGAIYVESPVYDIKETKINVVDEIPSSIDNDTIVIVNNPIQLKTINNQEIVGEGNIKIQTGDIIYENEYFTITSLEDNNIIGWETNYNGATKTISVSTDYGQTWTSYKSIENGVQIATLNAGDKLFVKGTETSYGEIGGTNSNFTSTKKFNVSGNIMSMLYGDDFVGQTVLPTKYTGTFVYLFKDCIKLISAENLILPATTLMTNCYVAMFYGCTSLTTTPELPATTLTQSCYHSMFRGCTSLTTTPTFPATTLATYCYGYMFYGCTALRTTPELPATTSASSCYESMFYGCQNLNFVKVNATSSASHSFDDWLNGVNSTGTIIKPSSLVLPAGVSGIPTGWNAYTEQEYEPIRVKDNVITSSTSGLKIEVVAALPANPDNNTIYIVQ